MSNKNEKNSNSDVDALLKELEAEKIKSIALKKALDAEKEAADSVMSKDEKELAEAIAKLSQDKEAFTKEKEVFVQDMERINIDVKNPPRIDGKKIWVRAMSRGQKLAVVHTDKGPLVRAINVKEGDEFEMIIPEKAPTPKWVELLSDKETQSLKERTLRDHRIAAGDKVK